MLAEVRIAAVEPVPAHPQQAGTDRDHGEVVRGVDLAVTLQTRADDGRRNEAGSTGREVNHVTTREVEHALLGEVTAAPDHERVDDVGGRDPDDHERDPRLEVEPAEDRAQHQNRRDCREDQLEVDQRRLRERALEAGRRQRSLVQQRRVRHHRSWLADEVSEEASTVGAEDVDGRAEPHLVAPQHPDDDDQGERDEGHHHRVDRPSLLHHAAIQDSETGQAHQSDERRRGHLPGVIACAQPIHRFMGSFPFRSTGPPRERHGIEHARRCAPSLGALMIGCAGLAVSLRMSKDSVPSFSAVSISNPQTGI